MDLYSLATVLENIVGKYSTTAATWWLFCTFVRIFVVVQVVVETYGDESGFKCQFTGSPGCLNQCYMHFAPISLASFWTISMFCLMIPFLIFNNLLEWVQIKNEIHEQESTHPSWAFRTMSIMRKRKGKSEEQLWSPLIAFALILKLIIVVIIEIQIINIFLILQCKKYNIDSEKCYPGRFISKWHYLTIPEVYACYTNVFSVETFFGQPRNDQAVCQGDAGRTTCYVPNAVQKSFLNLALIALTFIGLFFIFIELALTSSQQVYRGFKVYRRGSRSHRPSPPDISAPLEFVELSGKDRFIPNVDEPMLFSSSLRLNK